MEYVYAAMLLHKADQEITEDNVTGVLEAANIDVDESRVKALVAALEDVDIEESIASAVVSAPAGGAAPAEASEADEEEEEEEEEASDEEDEEAAAEGLGNLF